ncbi:glycosyltransferase involved in cell wall biosynthesis [Comamonas odontotermitis]|uniref:Glycosyltransferase involved in cell wall biosynthesis n=1 Tax=Comamonas odontotermitis TaxID=379895 RepID=A0ABR6RB99_9BURK|nr:glycosyltransferase family 2 protein [Comamonas odontotermitis]MBB6576430.1 glycosyltransferase involved in cell wall biosynthesis [Comamonas odontotermitis]
MTNSPLGGAAASRKLTLTIGILTLNEEDNIKACISSASFADQVIVVDSGSTDRTTAIACEQGAQVYRYDDWQGFAVQRNRLLAHATGDYVFFLDADEVISPAFRQELQSIVQSGTEAIWMVRWRMVAFGKELKYLRSTAKVERLFWRGLLREYTGVVHEEAQLSRGDVPRHLMKTPLLHYSRNTVHSSLEKLTQYAMLGAAKRAQEGARGGIWRGIASSVAMFLRLYILHFGFLCGGAGFLYCVFVALESFFRYVALAYDRPYLSGDVRR